MTVYEMTNDQKIKLSLNPLSADIPAHLFLGIEVKICKGEFVPKKNAKEALYSRAHIYAQIA